MSVVMHSNRVERGFSLVELSLVVIIVGLVLGGILAGTSLLEVTKGRKIAQEAETYLTAARNFESKYLEWPGDMSDALSYWATAINGDGDGLIEWDFTAAVADPHEGAQAFVHLTQAGFINKGNLTGVNGAPVLEVNVPQSEAFDGMVYLNNDATLGNFVGIASTEVTGVISPSTALSVDQQMDDGYANSGRVRDFDPASGCSSGADYVVTDKNPVCALTFTFN